MPILIALRPSGSNKTKKLHIAVKKMSFFAFPNCYYKTGKMDDITFKSVVEKADRLEGKGRLL